MTSELETILSAFGEQIDKLIQAKVNERVALVQDAIDGVTTRRPVGAQRKYSAHYKARILTELQGGKISRRQLAKREDIGHATIDQWLKKPAKKRPLGGIHGKSHRTYTKEFKLEMLAKVDGMKPAKRIAVFEKAHLHPNLYIAWKRKLAPHAPDQKRTVRTFKPEYKAAILAEVAAARSGGKHGAISAIFKREGLHHSLVEGWEKQASAGR